MDRREATGNISRGLTTTPSLIGDGEKTEYIKAAEAKIENWENIIAQLRRDAKSIRSDTRKQDLEKTAHDLQAKCQDIRSQITDMKLAILDWKGLQEPIEAGFRDLQVRYSHALAE